MTVMVSTNLPNPDVERPVRLAIEDVVKGVQNCHVSLRADQGNGDWTLSVEGPRIPQRNYILSGVEEHRPEFISRRLKQVISGSF